MPDPEPEGDGAPRLPLALDHERHIQLRGRSAEPWIRRGTLAVLAAVVAAGALNVFGQQDDVSRAAGPAGRPVLRVSAPTRLRGGDFYQGKLEVVAARTLRHPTLVLGAGWTEQMQLNTIEPSPDSESAPDGRLHLGFAPMRAGERLTVWLQLEVNPVSLGRRDQSVQLLDGDTPVAKVTRRVTVFF